MKHSFYLKYPNADTESLIYFTCYFKHEGKKFVYSTGEKINPSHWDSENRYVILRGKNRSSEASSIKLQLDRYSNCFEETQSLCKKTKEDFTSQILRKAFNEEFKKAPTGKNVFFDAYEEFMEISKIKKSWSKSTIKRYTNVKNILKEFEKTKRYKITFSTLNDTFERKFSEFCRVEKGHIDNTYSRNLGFLITFMHWSVKKKYTYNLKYRDFQRPKEKSAQHVIFEIEDLKTLMDHECSTVQLEKIRDVFVFDCLTGMRISELKVVNKANIINGAILLKEQKSSGKQTREIPLNDLSMYILRKYDYRLPLISSQKINERIKDVAQEAGFTQLVEKTSVVRNQVIRESVPFYSRVTIHTARRTFITLLKEKGYADKLIAKITGHTDMRTLNKYYQARDKSAKEAVINTFDFEVPTLKKA